MAARGAGFELDGKLQIMLRSQGVLRMLDVEGLPRVYKFQLVCVGGVVTDVDLQRAGFTDPCGWKSVQILWRIHPPPHGLLLTETDKCYS